MSPEEYKNKVNEICSQMEGELKLNPPADMQKIHEIQQQEKFQMDKALADFWQQFDGGEADCPFFARPGYLTGYDFMSFEEAMTTRESIQRSSANYSEYVEPEIRDKRINAGWFQPGWLPFGNFGGHSLLLISDMSPSESGQAGQVIGYVHDPDQMVYIADSFATFLQESIATLAADPEEYYFDI